ncbi:MAG: YiiD C-terminal domain-containing protein [Fuerstiella sp.]
MTNESLEAYIHRQIPITSAMGVQIVEATADRVELSAPLAPNINHRETVFGGSAAAVATLAAWTLVLVRMRTEDLTGRLVISRNSMVYQKPIVADFTAVASADELNTWEKFVAGMARKGRGRLQASSRLLLNGDQVAEFEGQFVAISH